MRFFAIFKRDFKNMLFSPMMLLYMTVFPMALVLVLGYLNSGTYGSKVTSYDYYGISILVYCAFGMSCNAANNFMEAHIKASNMRIIFSPVNTSYIYISKILATFAFSAICLFPVVGILNIALNVNFGSKFIYVLILLMLLSLSSSAVGILFCCIFKSEELANKILSIINNSLAFLGGTFIPLEGFGKTIRVLSGISPVTWIQRDIFKIIYDGNTDVFLPEVLALIGAFLVATVLCKITFRTEDYI